MPIKLHELQAKTKETSFDYDGENVKITYRPGAFTAEVESRLQEALQNQLPAGGIAEELSHLVAKWDVLDEAGKPLPVTVSWLRQFPVAFLNAIVEAIGRDMRPNASSAGD